MTSFSNLVFVPVAGFILLYPTSIFLFKSLHIYVALWVIIIAIVKVHRSDFFFQKTFFLAGGIYLLPIVSLATTNYPSATKLALLSYFVNIGLALLASQKFHNKLPKKIALIALIFALVAFASSMSIILAFGSLRPTSGAMKDIVGSYSNGVSSIAILSLPYLFWAKKHRILKPRLVNFAIIACVYVTIMSGSRAALIMVGLTILCMQWVLHPKAIERAQKVLFVLLATFFIAIYSYLTSGADSVVYQTIQRLQASQIFDLLGSAPNRDAGDFARVAMYSSGIMMIGEFWPLGSGLGGLAPYMEDTVGFGYVSHNILITAFGELGMVGGVGYSIIFYAIYRRLKIIKMSSSKMIADLGAASIIFFGVFILYSFTRPINGIYIFPLLMGLVLQLSSRSPSIVLSKKPEISTGRLEWRSKHV